MILKKRFALKIKDSLILLSKKECHKPLNRERIKENLRILLDRFEDEMNELYYNEIASKDEISILANELLESIK